MKKPIKLKRKKFPKGTPIIYCPDPLTYVFATQDEWNRRMKEKEREFYSDIWGRMMASLRGEKYAD